MILVILSQVKDGNGLYLIQVLLNHSYLQLHIIWPYSVNPNAQPMYHFYEFILCSMYMSSSLGTSSAGSSVIISHLMEGGVASRSVQIFGA